ncbi:GTP pyrophosphokinase [Pseudomonas aeruginosa]|uniref:GTP pyrophosphokinase n=1 Tax=Pseudomonas aeruginosa TaxID=287 RepID=UPI0009412ACF|nr:hypothetical protein [Pseudomonas aeruginosa]MBG7344046.1 hypothetical protein [Pseudomonas aeruginosa]MCO2353397.1 hypothetical protein [Pseudomonas aeruginosa]MCO2367093.1 hypothetical protein [Pseudomonas aeruginosa]MCO3276939.1 hypothetical protein [Pseudomonas aeruginosa]OKR75158.1 hypothetical protein BH601_24945 [Pseudomonas aeruginosa]
MTKTVSSSRRSNLTQEFDEKIELYTTFCRTAADLIDRLLDSKNIKVHTISWRCKTRESFERKIVKKGKYKLLSDITDIAGVRIITNYSDEVDLVAAVIEKEFQVDRENTIDKRIAIDPDRFGYLSLHYVASLKPARLKLVEYTAFSNIKFEIQIRSILQHTWAEIEHDIGYKSEVEVPAQIKRKFSRLAGLLELADQEFIAIRREQDKYVRMLSQNISRGPKHIGLDKESYLAFVGGNAECIRIDKEICEIFGYSLTKAAEDNSRAIQRLAYFEIKTVEQLEKKLKHHEKNILRFSTLMRNMPDEEDDDAGLSQFAMGISVFYLLHVLVARTKNQDVISEYLSENSWQSSTEDDYLSDILFSFFED